MIEWSCYIVQSAIVPGCMYLTDNFICFYAALPKGQVIYLYYMATVANKWIVQIPKGRVSFN